MLLVLIVHTDTHSMCAQFAYYRLGTKFVWLKLGSNPIGNSKQTAHTHTHTLLEHNRRPWALC